MNGNNTPPGKVPKLESVPVVGGRQSLKERIGAASSVEDFPKIDEMNFLDVDESLKAYLRKKGFECRFIAMSRYIDNSNFHPSNWKPWIVPVNDDELPKGPAMQKFGVNSDGLIIRGDLVLAVKPITQQDNHRKAISARKQTYNQVKQRQEKDFNEFAKSRGVKTKAVNLDE